MLLKKSSEILIYSLIVSGLFSCTYKGKAHDSVLKKKETNSILEEKEWFGFIDSVYTYSLKNEKYIDSVSLYFMKVNTPSVLAESKFILWRNSKPIKNGEFNLFIPLNTYQFLIVSKGSRNIILNEIEIDSIKIKESKKVLLDLNNSNLLKDPCNQISKINHKVTNQSIVFKVQIFQLCSEEYFYEELIYPFPKNPLNVRSCPLNPR